MRRLFALARPIAGLMATCLSTPLAMASPLDSYAWKNRVLILFAADENAMVVRQRDALLAEKPALAERDMAVFTVLADDRILPILGRAPAATDAAALRARYDVPATAPFTAVLVGKDGGVKLRQDEPVPPDQLFGLIDSMPMRRGAR